MLMMQGRGILHCRGIRKYSSNPLETLMNTHCCPKTSMLILSRAMKVNLEAAASVSVSETTATMQTKREASPTAEASEPKRKSTAPRERSQGKDAKHGKGEFKKRDKEPQRMPRELKEGEEKQVRLPKKKTAVLIGCVMGDWCDCTNQTGIAGLGIRECSCVFHTRVAKLTC